MSVWQILANYHTAFLQGLGVTVELSAIVWGGGLVLGVPAGAIAARFPRIFGWPFRGVTFIIVSIPVIVLLVWANYPAQEMLGVVIDPFITSAVVLTAVNILAVGDTVRAAMLDFPRGLIDAARVSGLTEGETLRYIQLPLIFRSVSPALLQQQVVMLQATIFASLISVNEIFRVAQRVNAQVYRPVQIYSALAFFFLAVCVPLNAVAHLLNARLRRSERALRGEVA